MPNNVEIKCKVKNRQRQWQQALNLATSEPVSIDQHDTFFKVPNGKLKLRRFSALKGELIYYHRDTTKTPALSEYFRSCTEDPDGLTQILTDSMGVLGQVQKRRELLLSGRTRIHFDSVKNLGDFIELEVVLDQGEDVAMGIAEAHTIMAALDIDPEQHIHCTYLDLLRAQDKTERVNP